MELQTANTGWDGGETHFKGSRLMLICVITAWPPICQNTCIQSEFISSRYMTDDVWLFYCVTMRSCLCTRNHGSYKFLFTDVLSTKTRSPLRMLVFKNDNKHNFINRPLLGHWFIFCPLKKVSTSSCLPDLWQKLHLCHVRENKCLILTTT